MNAQTIGLVVAVIRLLAGLGYVGYLYSTTAPLASEYIALQKPTHGATEPFEFWWRRTYLLPLFSRLG